MEADYRQYFDKMPCYVSVQDKDFRIIESNQRFKVDFGNKVGGLCYEVYKKRSDKCLFCPVELTFRDGKRYGSEEVVQTLNGQMVSVLVYTTPIYDEKGEIKAVMEMSTDVTEIKILQDRLRESQDRFRLLFDEAPCYISIQDKDFNLIEVNRRFREDFGNVTGGHCYEVYKHRNDVCQPCAVAETFKDGQSHQRQEVVTSGAGQQIDVLCYTAPIFDRNGKIASVMEMSANITELQKLQSQLTSVGLMISSISHSLKGLLNGLDGGMYMVNSGFEKKNDERVEKGWEMVQRNISRVKYMVMDILYYAKDRELKYETLEAEKLADEAFQLVVKNAEKHGVIMELNVDGGAGQFNGDNNSLRSLLVNLLENALEACRVDIRKEEHKVTLKVIGDNAKVIYEICDNGVGMDRETREKAFTLFYSSKGAEGTGLGLFVADQIARRHGGSINIDSEEGKGAKFIVSLPRRRFESGEPYISISH